MNAAGGSGRRLPVCFNAKLFIGAHHPIFDCQNTYPAKTNTFKVLFILYHEIVEMSIVIFARGGARDGT